MWKVVNVSEVPVKITQFGSDVIVPYDGKVYTFTDDTVFEQYKSLFRVIEEPKIVTIEEKIDEVVVIPPLKGTKIHNAVRKEKKIRKKKHGSRKIKKRWTFISSQGDVYDDVNIYEMKDKFNCDVRTFYNYANKDKLYKGWKISYVMEEPSGNR